MQELVRHGNILFMEHRGTGEVSAVSFVLNLLEL